MKYKSTLIVVFISFMLCNCTLTKKDINNTEPIDLTTLIFTDYGTYYSHIITINSNYELIYKIGKYNGYDTYELKDSCFPTIKRQLTPNEIKQLNCFISKKDSLHYQYPYEVLDSPKLNLYIKNKHTAYFIISNLDKNKTLYKFTFFLLNLIDEPYELIHWIDDAYLNLFPSKKLKKSCK